MSTDNSNVNGGGDGGELEVFRLPDGTEVKTGLVLPGEGEVMPASVSEYPEEFFLEDRDIERALADAFYLESRKRLAPYMINQARLGKCNPSANVGAMDQARQNQGHKHVPLCDNQLYWNVNGGRDVGSSLISTFREIQEHGVSRRTIRVDGRDVTIPGDVYNRAQLSRGIVAAADEDARLFMAIEAYLVPKEYGAFKRTLASALARRHPIVWAWHVGPNGMRLNGGYMNQGRGPGNHSNCLHSAKFVGGEDIVHPDNRNSWGPTQNPIYGPTGTGWGENGFALVRMEDAYECLRYHDFYVVTSVKFRPDIEIIDLAQAA